MIDVKFIKFLTEHKISAEAYIVIWCLYKQEFEKLNSYIKQFTTENDLYFKLVELETCKFIKKGWSIDNLTEVEVTDKFRKLFIQDNDEAANEIWSIYYPKIEIVIQGRSYSPKGLDYDDFVLMYRGITKGVLKRHQGILEVTKNYIKANPKCLMSLKKYMGTRFFDEIKEKYKNGIESDPFMEI